MFTIGWDWASDKHHLVLLDANGSPRKTWAIPHCREALHGLVATLAELHLTPPQVQIGIEGQDGPIIPILRDLGFTVYPINPKQVQAARSAFHASAAKDDVRDATVMALMVHQNPQQYRPDTPSNPIVDELQQLTEQHDLLTAQSIKLKQQLHALLRAWAPELLALIANFDSAWTSDLLQLCPLPQGYHTIKRRIWLRFFTTHRLTHVKREALTRLASSPLFDIPQARYRALCLQIRQLSAQLALITQQLTQVDHACQACFQQFPAAESQIFTSLPLNEGYLIYCWAGLFNSDRQAPPAWQYYGCRAGVCPITISSGKSRKVRRRRGCDQHLQQALMTFAFLSTRTEAWARDFYQKQRANHVTHHAILRQLARKWLRIIYSMWRHQRPYDPTLIQKNATAA